MAEVQVLGFLSFTRRFLGCQTLSFSLRGGFSFRIESLLLGLCCFETLGLSLLSLLLLAGRSCSFCFANCRCFLCSCGGFPLCGSPSFFRLLLLLRRSRGGGRLALCLLTVGEFGIF